MTVEMFYAVALFEIPIILILAGCLAAIFLRDRSPICSGCGAPIDVNRVPYWQCSHGHNFHLACAEFHSVVRATCCREDAIGSDSESGSQV